MGQATYPEVVASFFAKARFGRAALFDASLFGLALRGVCLAARVTTQAPVRSYLRNPFAYDKGSRTISPITALRVGAKERP